MGKTGLGRIALSGLIGAIISVQINLIISMAHGLKEAFVKRHNAPELIVLVAALFYAFQASYYFIRIAEDDAQQPVNLIKGSLCQNMAIGGIFYAVVLTTTYLLKELWRGSIVILASFIIFYIILLFCTCYFLIYVNLRELKESRLDRIVFSRSCILLLLISGPYIIAFILQFLLTIYH